MEIEIRRYLARERGCLSPVVQDLMIAKITKYEDILEDFAWWLKDRNYERTSVEVNGYTAKEIFKMAPRLDGIGVFNFLVTLRDNPDTAQKIIAEGFVVQ